MKLKSAAGYSCLVTDLNKTADFYEKLGLQIKKRENNRLIIYLNWYRIDFVKIEETDRADLRKEAALENKGAGVFLYFSVDNVDETYEEMISLGLTPETKPKDEHWGNREFVIRDPDGYKLVIFKRKVAHNPLD
jgi:catechol 2,3-dioxygenase-like lactoylglutathione lyase family enzyme